MTKIGIIGNGFVGNAIYQNIKDKFDVLVYDINKKRSYNTLNETYESDIIFVCLPTPMKHENGAECNLNIINEFFNNIPKDNKALFAIKSTVPIGTTKRLQETRNDLKIVHNPEFLTAINAVEDYKKSSRNIVGGIKDGDKLIQFYNYVFPNAKNILVSSDESETIKYFANTYLATKVTFFNILYDISEKYDMNYENIINGVCSDERIGLSHTKVPGPDGDRGFGGSCFPKDINSLIHTLESNNINSSIFKEIWEYNKKIRKNWDWSNNQSAVNKN